MKHAAATILFVASHAAARSAGAADFAFPVPSDDRWHYPFNFTPGARPAASVFSTFGDPDFDGFNDRDAAFIVAWETGGVILPGLALESYDVCSVEVTLRNAPGAAWRVDGSVDEWFTFDFNGDGGINRDGISRGAPGDRDGESTDVDAGRPIELFGVGFGPTYDYATWVEDDAYAGAECDLVSQVCHNFPRDPYPFVYQPGTAAKLHVEDSIKGFHNAGANPPLCNAPTQICPFTPVPWAVGMPINYVPNNQPTPFDVVFDVNLSLSEGNVRKYFQEQLRGGRLFVEITTLLFADFMSSQTGYPVFYTRDATGPGVRAPHLLIRLQSDPIGDLDGDSLVHLSDFKVARQCIAGPGRTPSVPPGRGIKTCLCAFDADADADVDLRDLARIQNEYTGN